jgi:hypothetical protein
MCHQDDTRSTVIRRRVWRVVLGTVTEERRAGRRAGQTAGRGEGQFALLNPLSAGSRIGIDTGERVSGRCSRTAHAREMPGFHPDLAARRARFGTKRSSGRQPQPRLRLEALAGFFDAPLDHEQLRATRNRQRDRRAGRPPHARTAARLARGWSGTPRPDRGRASAWPSR